MLSDVDPTGGTVEVFWRLHDDETLSVGDTATVRIRVRSGGETLVMATRSVAVESDSRSCDC